MMRRISILERSLGQLATPQTSSQICRSCRLQGAISQRRQLQSSTQQKAENGLASRLKSTIFGKSDSEKSSDTETAVTAKAQNGGKQGKQEILPAGWAESPETDPNYIEATSWDKLERVGSDSWVEDQFDPYDSYEGWAALAKNKKLDKREAEEVLLPIAKEIISGQQGQGQGQLPTSDGEWLRYRLSDPAVKFGIAKLVQQRTGLKISDYALNSAASLRDIRQVLLFKPEAKKLAEALKEEEDIKELSNIKVHSRRVTPIDKEKAVGRWKMIEQELIDRGLPVTGHSGRAKRVQTQVE